MRLQTNILRTLVLLPVTGLLAVIGLTWFLVEPTSTAVAITIACLVVVFLLLFAGRSVSNHLSKQVHNLRDTIDHIREGDVQVGDLSEPIEEIDALSEAVNSLSRKLANDTATRERLERVRSEFLANVSHELRTPIFSLQGFLETLLDGAIDDPKVNRDFLGKAHKHSERLNTLLSDLIEISRIESGEMKMSFRYFPILEMLEPLVDEMKAVAGERNLTLTLESDFDRSAKVYGDKARLRQVMTNLIDNAIKYTDPGGKVICSAKSVRNQCRINVEDTGSGIDEKHQSRIFERFYRVDKDRSREVGGTGLGLAITKHIVEAHGGTISIRSQVGKGTIFSFNLKR